MFIVLSFLLSQSHPKLSLPLCLLHSLLHPNKFSLWVYDAAACPDGKKVKTCKSFIYLPTNDEHCSSVDRKHGLWIVCVTCNKSVTCRNRRTFTLARWNNHKNSPEHKEIIRRLKEVKLLVLKKKMGTTTLTALENATHKQLRSKQSPLFQWYGRIYTSTKKGPSRGLI